MGGPILIEQLEVLLLSWARQSGAELLAVCCSKRASLRATSKS